MPSENDQSTKAKTRKEKKEKTEKKDRTITLNPTVVVLATYVLLLISKLIDITLLNRDNEYLSVVILQIMVFLLPAAIWCKLSGENYIKKLRVRPPRANAIPIILVAPVLMASGALLISMIFGGLDNLSGNFTLYNTFTSNSGGGISGKLYLVIAYAALPAICEEFVYRGILCCEYERGGVTRALIFSTLFFTLLHFDVKNLPVYLFAGIILALTFYVTRSLLGSILAHFLYNLFGIFGQPYMNTLYNITESEKFFVFLITVIFLLSAGIFSAEGARLYKKYLYRGESTSYRYPLPRSREEKKDSYLRVLKAPSAIASFAVYIIAIIISFL